MYNLFSTLSNLYVEGEKRMEGGQSDKVRTSTSDYENGIQKDVVDNGLVRVVFKGHVYEVELDELKDIPPNQDPQNYIRNNKKEYIEYAFERYKNFVEESRDYIGVFLYGKKIYGADKNIVKEGLSECLNYFVETEDYESASKARDLLAEIECNYD